MKAEIIDSYLVLTEFFEERNHAFFIFVSLQSLSQCLTHHGFSGHVHRLIRTLSLLVEYKGLSRRDPAM